MTDLQSHRCLLRNAVLILMLGTGLGLATGSSGAEGAEQEIEEPHTEASGVHEATQKPPIAESRPSRPRAELLDRQKQWWMHTREVLFSDVELSAEQTRQVDEIVEAQLRTRARFQQRDADLKAARRQADTERGAPRAR